MTDISREAVEALRSRLVHQCNAALSMPVPMTGIAEISRQAEEMIAALRAEVDALEAKLVEAQAPDISALRNSGFAPGSYHCFCSECGKTHTADKRAWRCLECAEKHVEAATAPITPAEAAKVLLEWANDMASEDDQRAIMAEIDAPFQHFEDALRAIAQEGQS